MYESVSVRDLPPVSDRESKEKTLVKTKLCVASSPLRSAPLLQG